MINSLSILSKVTNRRRVAILGDILELGSFSEEIHRNIGKNINSNKLDILITIGNESRYIREETINNLFPKNKIYSYNNYQEALNKIQDILKENDIVLLKAFHGMQLTKIVEYLTKK